MHLSGCSPIAPRLCAIAILVVAAACTSSAETPEAGGAPLIGPSTTPATGGNPSYASNPVTDGNLTVDGLGSITSEPTRMGLGTDPIGGIELSLDDDGEVVVTFVDVGGPPDVDVEGEILPDAEAVELNDVIAVLSGPTDRYAHGILGDDIEATAISVIDESGSRVVYEVGSDEVIEGRRPMWLLAGVGPDQINPLLVVTVSTPADGSRLVVVDPAEPGEPLAQSAAIGKSSRWRHQIGAAQFGDGFLVVDVLTPHIGGSVEFFRIAPPLVELVAISDADYSSHAIRSRNLDMALIGDADGNGSIEVVVPTKNQDALAGVTPDGEQWRVELGARLTSNIAVLAVEGEGDERHLIIAAGLANGSVLVWDPR